MRASGAADGHRQAAKAVSASGASAFRLPAASAGGAFGAHPARFRVSRHGRSDHSAPQRADRANFSEGTAGGTPVTPERGLGGRDLAALFFILPVINVDDRFQVGEVSFREVYGGVLLGKYDIKLVVG